MYGWTVICYPAVFLRAYNLILSQHLKGLIVQAAWTRRSRSEAAKKPNRKSWKQRTDMYMRPFLLNVFFSKRFVHAKVMHRGTSKVISVATTNAKDLRNTLPSLTDNNACRVIGKLIAERSKEADVHAIAYELKKNERVEGRLAIILDTIQENGIIFVWCFTLCIFEIAASSSHNFCGCKSCKQLMVYPKIRLCLRAYFNCWVGPLNACILCLKLNCFHRHSALSDESRRSPSA